MLNIKVNHPAERKWLEKKKQTTKHNKNTFSPTWGLTG